MGWGDDQDTECSGMLWVKGWVGVVEEKAWVGLMTMTASALEHCG